MSIEAVAAVLDGVTDVDPTAKLVLIALAEHARKGSALAWPSVPTIARRANVSERRAQIHLATLKARGWIAVERDSRGGRVAGKAKVYVTKVYRLNIERMRKAIANGDADGTVTDDVSVMPASPLRPVDKPGNGDAGDGLTVMATTFNGDAGVVLTVTPASPEPVLNRKGNRREPEKHARSRAQRAPDGALPDWIPRESFDAYARHRREIRKPLRKETTRALLAKLDRLRADGEDVAACLDQSVANGWTGVFPVKGGRASAVDDEMFSVFEGTTDEQTADQSDQADDVIDGEAIRVAD